MEDYFGRPYKGRGKVDFSNLEEDIKEARNIEGEIDLEQMAINREEIVLTLQLVSGYVKHNYEIEIPDDEDFQPSKAQLCTTVWRYPDDWNERTYLGLVYDGKYYPVNYYDYDGRIDVKEWDI